MRIVATLSVLCLAALHVDAQSPAPGAVHRPTTPAVWHPQLEHIGPAGTIQIEFGSALSESGFAKLRAALPWTSPSERTDYYFDAYDGRQFLLRTGGNPLKVRIKAKKQKTEWQVSRFVAKDQISVNALSIKVHTTESWQAPLDSAQFAALVSASNDFTTRLSSGGVALRAAADAVEAAWQKLRSGGPLPGVMLLDHTLAGRPYHFYPRKVTTEKTRFTAKLPGVSNPTVSLTLGSEPEFDEEGRRVLTYELEAEPDGPTTKKQVRAIAREIGRMMHRAGLTPLDQQEVVSLSNEYTLRQLAR